MRSLVALTCLIAALTLNPTSPAVASPALSMLAASATASSEIPLVVIRFNQPRISYSKQLYTAISKAVEIKPSVSFELVSYIPMTPSQQTNSEQQKKAAGEVAAIMGTLTKMGIPQNRIKLSRQPDNEIKFHEAHLYVY
jgi:hypothetical protein